VDGLAAFFGALPEEDLTFVQDVPDPAIIAQLPHTPDPSWIAIDSPVITFYTAVERLPDWPAPAGSSKPKIGAASLSWAGLATVHTAGVWGATSARRRRPSMAYVHGSIASVPAMPSR